ncbi:helix-turn-helix domain-containing protein [Clostridium akagii]|uniref:helix-turn-helix domain-containing protein n=1 Tax=Clostridium akagii TaxID=91623 RepID=UPI00047A3CEE|nr:helix-turn-helix transcriptional regulator [Clostridium akagii]
MDVGSRIKEMREKQQISQIKLAKKLKILNQSQICKIENGKRGVKVEELTDIAKALGIPITQIIE